MVLLSCNNALGPFFSQACFLHTHHEQEEHEHEHDQHEQAEHEHEHDQHEQEEHGHVDHDQYSGDCYWKGVLSLLRGLEKVHG